jgi:hypothetical protein
MPRHRVSSADDGGVQVCIFGRDFHEGFLKMFAAEAFWLNWSGLIRMRNVVKVKGWSVSTQRFPHIPDEVAPARWTVILGVSSLRTPGRSRAIGISGSDHERW